MHSVGSKLTNRAWRNRALFEMLVLITTIISLGTVTTVFAQFRNYDQAKQKIRDRMIREQGGSSPDVRFNDDQRFQSISNNETEVTGSGTYYRNRNDSGRDFNYTAVFYIRNGDLRSLNYNWTGGGGGGGGGSGQTVYCASDDGRRRTCPANTQGGVRLQRQVSGSPCIQGQTWGYNRNEIWVDRGCRADFEVGYGGGGGGGWGGNRPNGRVMYSGGIINRNSNKGLDVSGGSRFDGANIQQWEYAGQANQNWDVIDIGNGVVAIINQNSGLALSVQGDRYRNGANIVQRQWKNNRQQRWRLQSVGDDYYAIINDDNGKCLDVSAQSRDNGANIQQWDYANQNNQKWRIRR